MLADICLSTSYKIEELAEYHIDFIFFLHDKLMKIKYPQLSESSQGDNDLYKSQQIQHGNQVMTRINVADLMKGEVPQGSGVEVKKGLRYAIYDR